MHLPPFLKKDLLVVEHESKSLCDVGTLHAAGSDERGSLRSSSECDHHISASLANMDVRRMMIVRMNLDPEPTYLHHRCHGVGIPLQE